MPACPSSPRRAKRCSSQPPPASPRIATRSRGCTPSCRSGCAPPASWTKPASCAASRRLTEGCALARYNRAILLYLFPERIETTAAGKPVLRWAQGAKPFGSGAQVAANSAVHEVLVMPEAFTAEECRRVRELGEALPPVMAQLERGNAAQYRTSVIAWIEPQPEAHWLYHRLGLLFLEANRRYRFELV